jgi:hypothetical protein
MDDIKHNLSVDDPVESSKYADLLNASHDSEDDDVRIVVDEDDEDNLFELTQWFAKEADVLPSVAKKYAKMLIADEVGSISRLIKRLTREGGRAYLARVGFKPSDLEDVLSALQR